MSITNEYQPPPAQSFEATIPTSQLRWRMSQLSQAGVPFDYAVNGARSVLTVPADHLAAAQAAMDSMGGIGLHKRRSGTWSLGAFTKVWKSCIVFLFGLAILPAEPWFAAACMLGSFALMPIEMRLDADVDRTHAALRAAGLRPGPGIRLQQGIGLLIAAVAVLAVGCAAWVAWGGIF